MTDVNGTTRLDPSITSFSVLNNLTLNDNVTVGGNITFTATNLTIGKSLNPLTAGGDVVFNVPNNLTITNIGNLTSFANITSDSPGRVFMGGNINATTNMSIGDNVTLIAATTVNSPIAILNGTVDGPFLLTVNAATTSFGGNIGATTALAGLVTDANGTTTFGSRFSGRHGIA